MAAAKTKLTEAQKRVAIAKDVIAQVKAGKYQPKTGLYVEMPRLKKADVGGDWQDVVKRTKTCEACALGCALLSEVRLFNNFPITEDHKEIEDEAGYSYLADSARWRDRLRAIFGAKQMSMIETAFECAECVDPRDDRDIFDPELDRAGNFCFNMDEGDRLLAIMWNIVRNKGTFKP